MLFSRKNSIWKDASPTGAVKDFVAVFRDAGPNRGRIALAALFCTGLTFSLLTGEEHRVPQRMPEIIYINSWRADRSDEEIKASNVENQKVKEALAEANRKDAEETKAIYKAIGRASGMDVDAIERQAKADDAAREAARAAAANAPVAPAPHR